MRGIDVHDWMVVLPGLRPDVQRSSLLANPVSMEMFLISERLHAQAAATRFSHTPW